MVNVFVYASEGVQKNALDMAFSQVEGEMKLITFNQSIEDSMIQSYAKSKHMVCQTFPKSDDSLLRDMELIDFCDCFMMIGDDPAIRHYLALGKMMKRKTAWFDKKGFLNKVD